MSNSNNTENRPSMKKIFEGAVMLTAGAAVLSAGILAGTFITNGRGSMQEFDGVQSQIRMLTENGDLTGKNGTPKNHVIEYGGHTFSISVSSALMSQNGTFRDAGGQIVSQNVQQQNQPGGGAMRSQTYSSSYVLQGVISRIKGSDHALRIFFNNGGERTFSMEWPGSKPINAPVSSQPFMQGSNGVVMIPVPLVTAPQ